MSRVLLTHARVVACSGDPTERPFDGDVLVDGDRVADVFRGRAPLDAGSSSVEVVDLAGATLMPGLCDAHTHISWPLDFVFDHPEITAMPDDEHALEVAGVVRTYLEAGYTLLVGAGALKPRVDVLVARAIDKGLIDGPRLLPSGEMITERGAIGAGNLREVGTVDEMRRAVGEQVELGVRSVKLMASGDGIVPGHPSQTPYLGDELVAAAVDEAERGGAFVTAHARGPEPVMMCVRNGVRIVHHATYLDDESISALTAARDDVWVCPACTTCGRWSRARPSRSASGPTASSRPCTPRSCRPSSTASASCARAASGSWPAATSATSGPGTAPTRPSCSPTSSWPT
jgi:imidazolonepropionase-like amidohydrolase